MDNKKAEDILARYNNGVATEEEISWVESWYLKFGEQVKTVSDAQIMEDELKSRLSFELAHKPKNKIKTISRITATAAAIVLISVAVLILFKYLERNTSFWPGITYENDIKPGQNKAILILANGKKIFLDDVAEGLISLENGVSITKLSNGQIVYTGAGTEKSISKKVLYNSIQVPRGGQYRVTLADGTKIWLNAETVLQYPIVFAKANRTVRLKGEAYFEVTKNKLKPFIVMASEQRVEVLGTHFNINSYIDEKRITTTLLEGSVQVFNTKSNVAEILKPGQKAVQQNTGLNVQYADIEEAVAWKNGFFKFNDEPIESVMRKISRWYNVDVAYSKDFKHSENFSGTVSRFSRVSKVLEKLELTGAIHFKVSERRILVMK